MSVIDKLIEIANAEVGYLEKSSNSQLDSKTANAGTANYTKYWRDIKPEYQGQPWCACFVTWCFTKAFGKDNAQKLLKHYPYVYCPTMANLFTLNANPKVGDIVIFKHNGTFTHTGIVTGVNGDYFTTIEGNTNGGSTIIANGGGVCRKSYYNSNLPGTKFCTPDWSIVEESEDLTMEQYNELKSLIEKQAAEINDLRNVNQQLVNVVQTTMVYDYVDDNMPDWARTAVQAAMSFGAIRGDENGRLGLSYKDLRAICREYRCGLYNR
ncbi:MAG: CHAP domain-containing protein [Clostridiales bacterium]|nr:CHAP domain-containing protein [Clostridiales bacterium]